MVLAELDPSIVDRFAALQAFLLALGDDVQETTLRFYISLKRIKNFACVEFRPHSADLHRRSGVSFDVAFYTDVSAFDAR